MCIISGPVNSVSATKIFAMPSRSGSRQLTVYSNTVNTPADNMMCLPVPYPETVMFERVPADLFTQCERSFTGGYPRGAPTLSVSRSVELEVRSHGSYDVVLIPSVDDTVRVPRHFATLTPEVVEFMRREYGGRPFGFLLCCLKAGASDYEPFAYSHATDGANLFLPTMHFHTHPPPSFQSWERPWRSPNIDSDIDWDHEIYTVRTSHSAHRSLTRIPRSQNEINWSQMPDEFAIGSKHQLRCWEITGGAEPNRDIILPLASVQTSY